MSKLLDKQSVVHLIQVPFRFCHPFLQFQVNLRFLSSDFYWRWQVMRYSKNVYKLYIFPLEHNSSIFITL